RKTEALAAGGQVPDRVAIDVARRHGAFVRAKGHVDERRILTVNPFPLVVDYLPAGHLPDLEVIDLTRLSAAGGEVPTVRAENQLQVLFVPLVVEEFAAGRVPDLDSTAVTCSHVPPVRAEDEAIERHPLRPRDRPHLFQRLGVPELERFGLIL